jgi:hypothetical protein
MGAPPAVHFSMSLVVFYSACSLCTLRRLAVAADREDMAVAVAGHPASRLPDAALAPVRGRAIGGEEPQTLCVIGQDPPVVIAEIAVRGEGCPAVISPARIRARIGFPVTGSNDTPGGSGCRDAGDDIGRPLIAASRSPRLLGGTGKERGRFSTATRPTPRAAYRRSWHRTRGGRLLGRNARDGRAEAPLPLRRTPTRIRLPSCGIRDP